MRAAGTIVSLGRIGTRVYNSANISIPNNTTTYLAFDTERFDVGACHSTASNTNRLTAPVTGKYLIVGHVELAGAADYTTLLCQILLNGTTIIARQQIIPPLVSGPAVFSIPAIYVLAATDYVELGVLQANGASAARNANQASKYSPEFAFYLLGG